MLENTLERCWNNTSHTGEEIIPFLTDFKAKKWTGDASKTKMIYIINLNRWDVLGNTHERC